MIRTAVNGIPTGRSLTLKKEKNMRNLTKDVAALIAAGAFVAAISVLGTPAKADTAAAEATYKSKCAMCHGADGKGQTPTGKSMKAKDFASEDVQKMSDAELADAITKGKAPMPAMKSLTPDQVKDLVSYVRAFGKKK